MIVGDKREEVIANIRQACVNKTFDMKVEVDDPALTAAQRNYLLDQYSFWQKKWVTIDFMLSFRKPT